MKVDSDLQSMGYGDDHSGGEDDGDFQSEDVSSNGFHTKADMRKSNKPIMEKRRRARINNCLNELKGILLEAMRKDPARHSKLEKADILELTVRHLQNVQRNQLAIAMATDPTVLHRFKNGFSECATEVSRYLGRLDGVEHGVRQRLTGHLGACVNGLQQVGPTPFGSPRYSPLGGGMSFSHIPPSPATPNTHGIHPSNPQASAVVFATGVNGLLSPQQTQDVNNNVSRSSLNLTQISSSSSSSTITSSSTPNLLNSTTSNSNSPNDLSMEHSHNTTNLSFELSCSHISKSLSNNNRVNSAFTLSVGTTPPPSPPPPPPTSLLLRTASTSEMSVSSGSLNEKGTNTTPLFNIGAGGSVGGGGRRKSHIIKVQPHATGLPLDFSLNSIATAGNTTTNRESGSKTQPSERDRCCDVLRGVKAEPLMQKADADSSSNVSSPRDSMWRPW